MTQRLGFLLSLAVIAGAATLSAQAARRVKPQAMPVRFTEGMVHGFLDLHAANGTFLASGDLTQTAKDGGISSRMLFHFSDGSVFDETVLFTQQRTFGLRSYHLVQRGPAFVDDLDASLLASGAYRVKATSHRDGKTKEYVGSLELPDDVSNGMVIMLLKNLQRRDTQTVHIVAFTPQPRLVELELAPVAEHPIMNGPHAEPTVEYTVKPHIGGLTGVLARLLGKMPADSHVWVVVQDVPAFVRFQGPLYSGPIWRLDLAAPRWPR